MPTIEAPSTALTEVAESVELGIVRANSPVQLVERATAAANALASVIESRKLYSNIQGKKFVRCEGWTTLAAMLGATPHEVSVTEVEGTFTAIVELRRLTDGQAIGRASAECGTDEATWKNRARNARRSMALTRATAKACRLAFSWIMALSGYEVTPAEEMASEETGGGHLQAVAGTKAPAAAPPPVRAQMPPQAAPNGDGVLTFKGKPLTDYTSDELVKLKPWMAKKDAVGFAEEIDAIDAILAGRGGE